MFGSPAATLAPASSAATGFGFSAKPNPGFVAAAFGELRLEDYDLGCKGVFEMCTILA
jgi:hypothetical protein